MSRLQPVIGTEIIDDIRLGHTWGEFNVLRDFLLNQKFDSFVEVGVHEGGLSYLLIPMLKDIYYMGIEIDCGIVRPQVKSLYEENLLAELVCANCFNGDIAIRVSALKNKIIYCDGGNKVKELAHFKYFCQSGDIIMAHDFWDGDRKVEGIPEIRPEVLLMDVVHLDVNDDFVRLDESIFKETRIIGWKKI